MWDRSETRPTAAARRALRPAELRSTLILLLLVVPTAASDPYCPPNPDNLALGKPYSLTPAPNYDHPNPDIDNQIGDETDLTDGCFVQASHGSEASVTWSGWPKAQVEIDLSAPGCVSDPA
ncbi:MAG: hypothetical protein JSV80_14925, partial [Acidobacteriota bacterium]